MRGFDLECDVTPLTYNIVVAMLAGGADIEAPASGNAIAALRTKAMARGMHIAEKHPVFGRILRAIHRIAWS